MLADAFHLSTLASYQDKFLVLTQDVINRAVMHDQMLGITNQKSNQFLDALCQAEYDQVDKRMQTLLYQAA